MQEIHLDTVQQFNERYGFETLHPLVSVVRYDRPQEVEESRVRYGLYGFYRYCPWIAHTKTVSQIPSCNGTLFKIIV